MKKNILLMLLAFASTQLMAADLQSASKCLLCHEQSGTVNPVKVNQTIAQGGADMSDEERKLEEHAREAAALKRR